MINRIRKYVIPLFLAAAFILTVPFVFTDDGSEGGGASDGSPYAVISAGYSHSLALRDDGTVWAWGYNYSGQLGDGTTTERHNPVQVMMDSTTPLTGVMAVSAAGNNYSLALKSDGTVWAWGYNYNGQLGDGTTTDHHNPVQVMMDGTTPLTGVMAISASGNYSMALKGDGTVWAWGINYYGQLGDGTTTNRSNPVQVMMDGTTPLTGVMAVSAGTSYSMALKGDGTVWAWGYNYYGKLGDGTTTDRHNPVQVMMDSTTPLTGVMAVSAGSYHSIALRSDGTVWAWGLNDNGQLGDGTITERHNPVQVMIDSTTPLTGVMAVSAGDYHSVALKSDGTVWAWGLNDNGQLGDGTITERHNPVQVMIDSTTPLTGVMAVSAGNNHSLALKDDGTVWAWGSNTYGRLGDGTAKERHNPVQVMMASGIMPAVSAGVDYSMVLKDDGTVWAWGNNVYGQLGDGTTTERHNPVQVMINSTTPLTGVMAVSAGYYHSIALKDDGTVWAWGANSRGQLGDGTTTERHNPVRVTVDGSNPLTGVMAVSAGDYHSVALKSDGTVWAWGLNSSGQLGDGTITNRSNPVQVMIDSTTPLTGVMAVSGGYLHSMALKDDGTVWAWGFNNYGQLGDGTTTERHNPVQVMIDSTTPLTGVMAVSAGSNHSLALKDDGTVWAWGYNIDGRLGDGTTTERHNPVQAMMDSTTPLIGVMAVSAGEHYSMALKDDGTVWAWGYNGYGQLGDGFTTSSSNPVQVMIDSTTPLTGVMAVSTGGNHSLALKDDGTVWAWGSNLYGRLGDGTTTDRHNSVQVMMDSTPPLTGVMAISGGYNHSMALKDDGTVWVWGFNDYGQLGDGTTTSSSYPVQVMIDSTTPLTGVMAVSAGYLHSMALKDDGTVWAWGLNGNSQLGDGTTTSSSYAVQVMIDSTTPLTGVMAVSAGAGHSMALKDDGTVWAWGLNDDGQLGNGTTTSSSYPVQVMIDSTTPLAGVMAVSAGTSYSMALKDDGTVWVWGYNGYGQLGDGTTTDRHNPVQVMMDSTTPLTGVMAVSAGAGHSMALKDDGTVWAWGNNDYGQLGDGTTTSSSYPVQVMIDSTTPLTGVIAVSAGYYHSIALKSTVWAWGWNNYGQLGDGNRTSSSYPVQVMIDSTTPLTGVMAISGGYNHSMALKYDGTVWAWGNNDYGQLGDGTIIDRHNPVQVMIDGIMPLNGGTMPAVSEGLNLGKISVLFNAEQTGGVSGILDSTGIVITFRTPVKGLTASDITITNGTGTATAGALSGSGTTWTVALSVAAEGDVTVSVGDFGIFKVNTAPQTVPVYSGALTLSGTVVIDNTSPKIGDVLTASETTNNTGTLSYRWKADGSDVGTDSPSYTVTIGDLGKVITVEISSSVQNGTVTSVGTANVEKKTAAAPAAPVLSSKTSYSVTLVPSAGYEYSMDDINWQTENTFTGLSAPASYSFYQRTAETADTLASPASLPLSVTIYAELAGSVTIDNTSPRIGDVLTASEATNNTGTLSYRWKADGSDVGTDSPSYTVTIGDLGKVITVEISSTNEAGALSSGGTANVEKKTAAAPAAPVLSSKTYNRVVLAPLAGYEYSKDGVSWQSGNTFTGLSASTSYSFYQRTAETADTLASPASPALIERTNSNGAASGPNLYALTIYGGNGSGSYAAGSTVSITADAPPEGKRFAGWSSVPYAEFADKNSASTTLTMPAYPVTVSPVWDDLKVAPPEDESPSDGGGLNLAYIAAAAVVLLVCVGVAAWILTRRGS